MQRGCIIRKHLDTHVLAIGNYLHFYLQNIAYIVFIIYISNEAFFAGHVRDGVREKFFFLNYYPLHHPQL